MRSVLCFGDSLTFGEKDLEGGGWVERLRRYFLTKEASLSHQQTLVYNLGIASETTDGLVSRLESEFKSRVIGKQPCVVVLSYGLNDIKIHKNKNIVPTAYFERNLRSALSFLDKAGACAFVLNIPPINHQIDGVRDQHKNLRFSDDVSLYNRLIEEIIVRKSTKVTYVDIHTQLKQSNQNIYADDQLHLNSIGHKLLFKQILELLESKVE